MAKKSTPKPAKKRVPPRRRKSGDGNGLGVLFAMAIVVLFFINRNTAILVFLGLAPTLVLGFTGKGDNKTQRLMCVGFANASGIMFLIKDVWVNPALFDRMIMDPNNWIIMWGAAAIGYALNYVGPMIAAMIMQGLAQDRVKNINQQKQELVEMWGHEVLGSKEDDKPDFIKRPGRS